MTNLPTWVAQSKQASGLNDFQLADAIDAVNDEFDRVAALPGSTGNTVRMSTLVEAQRLLMDEARGRGALTASGSPRGTVGGTMVERMARAQRAQPSPSHRPVAGRHAGASAPVVTASVSGPNVSAGQPLSSADELAELMSETLAKIARFPESGRRQTVATARWSYPEDRQLDLHDQRSNTAKLDAVCGFGAPRVDRNTRALVASGGICLPVNIDYSVPTWSTADRPLRDGLPAFQASRGGIRFVTPPDIGTVDLQGSPSGAGGATTVWTQATDADPGSATKPVWQVACGAEQLVYVNAIPTRVEFGNMQSRFAPEQVAANTEQAIATAAREAELELLELMYESSVQVKPQQYLGATRDLLASVDLLIAQYRYSHRIPKTASFTCVFPDWARDVMRSDLARELAHDNTNTRDVLAISDTQIDDWFATRGINVIWTLDGLKAGTYGTGGSAITDQFFALMGSGAPEPQWPGQSTDGSFMLAWLLFVEGSYQFLDGGRLDLGVVRDSVLDATNDYETFVEPFESVAFRGVEVYQVQSMILPNGASAGTTATSGYHE